MPGMETCPGKRSINVSKILLQMEASVSCLSTSSAYVCFLCGLSSHILVVHCKYIRYFYVKCACFYLLSPFCQCMAIILPPSMVEINVFCAIKNRIQKQNLPSLHQERVSPGFTLPVKLEPGGGERYPVEPLLIFALNKHTSRFKMPSMYSSDMALHVNTRPKLYFKARQILRRHRAALIWSISNAILKVSAECHNTGRKSSACVLTY